MFSNNGAAASPSSENVSLALVYKLEFDRRKTNSTHPDEIAFFTLVLDEKYEEAIDYASNMKDQIFGGRMILDLLRCRDGLGINVNAMNNNSLRQTPLHRAAINRKWHAYYALVDKDADSSLKDGTGTSASQYRHKNSMTLLDSENPLQIIKDLFGDSTPLADVNNICGLGSGPG